MTKQSTVANPVGIERLCVFGMPPVPFVELAASLGCQYIGIGLEAMRYYNPQNPAAIIKAFAEYNINNGIKMRVDVLDIGGREGSSSTLRYTDHIRFDEIYKREERENKRPRAVQVSLQGSF